MKIDFQVSGLPMNSFRKLFSLSDTELQSRGARRYVADSKPGFPCRVSLQDAAIGESVILLTYAHHPINGPYRSSGPIFVRELAEDAELEMNEIPAVLWKRLLSVRAYDAEGMLVASDVVEGKDIEMKIAALFEKPSVSYLHIHNAKPGCYSCRVDRAH